MEPIGTVARILCQNEIDLAVSAERARIRRNLLAWLAEQREVSRVDEWGTAYRDFAKALGAALDRICPDHEGTPKQPES